MIKILILFFIIAAAVILWFFYGSKNEGKTTTSPDSSTAIFKEEKSEKTISVSSVLAPSDSDSDSAQTKKYENTQYGFSFKYPAGFTTSEFFESDGKNALIIQNKKTNQVIQIYITSYDDPNFTVSAEQIRLDLPDMPFSNSADVIVGSKAKGVAFFSESEAFGGPTAEVWFADGKLFFQATASAKNAKILEEIIKSWKFQE